LKERVAARFTHPANNHAIEARLPAGENWTDSKIDPSYGELHAECECHGGIVGDGAIVGGWATAMMVRASALLCRFV
jgi:hypothetical protein